MRFQFSRSQPARRVDSRPLMTSVLQSRNTIPKILTLTYNQFVLLVFKWINKCFPQLQFLILEVLAYLVHINKNSYFSNFYKHTNVLRPGSLKLTGLKNLVGPSVAVRAPLGEYTSK